MRAMVVSILAALAASVLVEGSLLVAHGGTTAGNKPQNVPSAGAAKALHSLLLKVQGTDPKAVELLKRAIDVVESRGNATASAAPRAALLQLLGGEPSDAVQQKLKKLAPILAKLQGLDSKAFESLSHLTDQAAQQEAEESTPKSSPGARAGAKKARHSLLQQMNGPRRTQPAFGYHGGGSSHQHGVRAIAGTTAAAMPSSRGSHEQDNGDVERKMAALRPIFDKLQALDSKTFGALNNMVSEVAMTHQ